MEKKERKTKSKKQIVTRKPEDISSVVNQLVLHGDISLMNSEERVKYYNNICRSLGLNPLTQPFQIIKLQGKEVLYATRTATDQLRKINGVSIESIDQKINNDICITTVIVKDKSGRYDGATGAVNIKGLFGDMLANAMMKSETKAKRRATLSICGLGMIDESEIETIPATPTVNFKELEFNDNPETNDKPKLEKEINFVEQIEKQLSHATMNMLKDINKLLIEKRNNKEITNEQYDELKRKGTIRFEELRGVK